GPAIDLAPFSYVVQLAGTDAFQLLAGPSPAFEPGRPVDLVGDVLRVMLVVGAATCGVRLIWHNPFKSSTARPDGIVLLWLLAPPVASVAPGSIAVYVHHFVGTLPTQFILIALGITRTETSLRWVIARLQQPRTPWVPVTSALGAGLVCVAAGVQTV